MQRLGLLRDMKGKVHYVTIPEEDWHDLSQNKCFSFMHKYGVSGRGVWGQVRSGNTTNRTFPIAHIVPHLLSEEELLGDFETLKRIVRERELNGRAVECRRSEKLRKGVLPNTSTSDEDVEPCEVPPASPTPTINDALARVYDTRTTACFGLHLLVAVQKEEAEAQAHPQPACAGLRDRLQRLPMAVLHDFISELFQMRREWERQLLEPSAAALSKEVTHTENEKVNALLFHICLWQRRYPLELLLAVLSFHSDHRDAFVPASAADVSEAWLLECFLEEAQQARYPDLSDVPGLIRCDVLMSYPQMALEEQIALMRRVAAACQNRPRTEGPQPLTEGNAELWCHSRTPPDPRVLLKGFVDPEVCVPVRFCAAISCEGYRVLRAAFERHKRDGVRRLAAQDYACAPVPPPPANTNS